MNLIIGLCFITLFMLAHGMGMLAAFGLGGLAVAYLMVTPTPDVTFASLLAGLGFTAFIIQLGLNLKPEKKKD